MKVIIASDSKSVEFKNGIKEDLLNKGYEVIDKTEGKEVDFYDA